MAGVLELADQVVEVAGEVSRVVAAVSRHYKEDSSRFEKKDLI